MSMTEFTDSAWEALKARAAGLGTEHGTNAGEWVPVDGEESARAWLKGIEDGDPAVLDQLPGQPLSGEHADGYGMADLYRDLEITPEDDSDDLELCAAYEQAHSDAVQSEVERRAHYQLGE